jgi:hypothetical protein
MATPKKSTSSKSSLSRKTNQQRNTQAGRNRMASSSFALPKGTGSDPSKDQYRIDDKPHARNALARVAQHGTSSEQASVRAKVGAKFPSLRKSK